jgi:hypothetical protein
MFTFAAVSKATAGLETGSSVRRDAKLDQRSFRAAAAQWSVPDLHGFAEGDGCEDPAAGLGDLYPSAQIDRAFAHLRGEKRPYSLYGLGAGGGEIGELLPFFIACFAGAVEDIEVKTRQYSSSIGERLTAMPV